MEIKAIKNINIRFGEPSTSANSQAYVPIGTTVHIADLVIGQQIDGNAVWYKNTLEEYLWSGGFSWQQEPLIIGGKSFLPSLEVMKNIYTSASNELFGWFHDQYPDCTGIGVGYRNFDPAQGLALILHVIKKSSPNKALIPKTICYRGVMLCIDVVETGPVTALVASESLPMETSGGSISREGKQGYGTRTIMVSKGEPNENFILTCYHVAGPKEKKINEIYKIDIPNITANSPAHRKGVFHSGIIDSEHDYALIKVENKGWSQTIPNGGIVKEYYTLGEEKTLLNKQITFYGATGCINVHSVITSINVNSKKIDFGTFGIIYMNGLLTCTSAALPGDSGAAVVDENYKLIGYVIAADSGTSYILPFGRLSYHQQLTLST